MPSADGVAQTTVGEGSQQGSEPSLHFPTFVVLYTTALALEFAERSRHSSLAAILVAFLVVQFATRFTRPGFLLLLMGVTAHVLFVQLPDVANHLNFVVFANLALMAATLYSMAHKSRYPTDDDWFEMVRPLLQLSLAVIYFLAGFHKLNTDFLDPAISCVGWTTQRLEALLRGSVLGVPRPIVAALLVIAAMVGVLGRALLRRHWRIVGVLAALALSAAVAAVMDSPVSPFSRASVALGIVTVLAWELGGALLLLVRRTQGPVVALCLTMHLVLVPIGFVDFGSLALAMLFCFLPRAFVPLLWERIAWPLASPGPRRIHVYFALAVVTGIASADSRPKYAGVIFIAAVLVLLTGIIRSLVRPVDAGGLRWTGVPILWSRTPRWLRWTPALLLLHGATSYLGLRTAGNFSMFSNLRTEGDRSNHLLLAGNPLKIWGYQEDVVRVIAIDDRQARGAVYQYSPLAGRALPIVEFRKYIVDWREAGRVVPITFEYAGEVFTSSDIVADPRWGVTHRDWEMRLMDFRVIQTSGPNLCRW